MSTLFRELTTKNILDQFQHTKFTIESFEKNVALTFCYLNEDKNSKNLLIITINCKYEYQFFRFNNITIDSIKNSLEENKKDYKDYTIKIRTLNKITNRMNEYLIENYKEFIPKPKALFQRIFNL